jgi:iron complex outermembrane receptor protein
LAVGVAIGRHDRDGFTTNDLTGHDVDHRSAFFVKGQALWNAANWETRAIVTGERARDGDLALNDLAALRRNPFHVARDFEGRNDRNVVSTAVLTRRDGQRFTFASTTGLVRWTTRGVTDLDYTPLPLVTRDNDEEDTQFTQEFRLASAAGAPIELTDAATLKWQTGVFFFTQNYDQDAVNTFAPFVLSPFAGFSVSQHSPRSALDDTGVGVYGQGTVTFNDKLGVTVGARVDHETKDALLDTFYSPPIAAASTVTAEKSFSRTASGPIGWCTARSAAGSRRAASIPRRRPAARATAKRTRGTPRAASRPHGSGAG